MRLEVQLSSEEEEARLSMAGCRRDGWYQCRGWGAGLRIV